MRDRINLADPDVEPTDEELVCLVAEAFTGVAAANEASQKSMRARIATEREAALRYLESLMTRS